MKRALLCSVVLALLATSAPATDAQEEHKRSAPGIAVEFTSDKYPEYKENIYLPAVDKQAKGSIVMSGGVVYRDMYQVTSTNTEQFSVTVARCTYTSAPNAPAATMTEIGTPLTETLPVWNQKPDRSKWTKSGDGRSCAYLTHTSVTY